MLNQLNKNSFKNKITTVHAINISTTDLPVVYRDCVFVFRTSKQLIFSATSLQNGGAVESIRKLFKQEIDFRKFTHPWYRKREAKAYK